MGRCKRKDCLYDPASYICECGKAFSADPFFKARLQVSKSSKKVHKRRRLTISKRLRIFIRDNYTCCNPKCQKDLLSLPVENRVIDHIKPLMLGGTNSDENLQALCSDCDAAKGNREINYRQMKYEEDLNIRNQIDSKLEQLSQLEATLGVDSTLEEIEAVTKQKNTILEEIKLIDEEFYNSIKP